LAEGGLTGFVARFKKDFPNAIAIPSLATLRPGSDGMFNAEQVRTLRKEIQETNRFPLKGEREENILEEILDDRAFEYARVREPEHPARYHKSDFIERVTEEWTSLKMLSLIGAQAPNWLAEFLGFGGGKMFGPLCFNSKPHKPRDACAASAKHRSEELSRKPWTRALKPAIWWLSTATPGSAKRSQ
jgi:hypothetical protein